MTSDSFLIKKICFAFIFPRHSIENWAQLVFLPFTASRIASKNFSGSTSYFAERKARYSPTDFLCLKSFRPILFFT